RVIRLIRPKEPPDRTERADRLADIHVDPNRNGFRRRGRCQGKPDAKQYERKDPDRIRHEHFPETQNYIVGRAPRWRARKRSASDPIAMRSTPPGSGEATIETLFPGMLGTIDISYPL